MIRRGSCALLATCLWAGSAAFAATPRAETVPFGDPPPIDNPVIELRPGPRAPARAVQRSEESVSGNPLWSIPLSALNATRNRPLFSPSRRPPSPVVPPPAQPVAAAPPPPPPPPPPIQQLALGLIGTIGNGPDSIAIFVEQGTKNVVRLRVGEAYSGWVLRSVRGREALLEGASQTETIVMPKQD